MTEEYLIKTNSSSYYKIIKTARQKWQINFRSSFKDIMGRYTPSQRNFDPINNATQFLNWGIIFNDGTTSIVIEVYQKIA